MLFFLHHPQLYTINAELLTALCDKVSEWTPQTTIGDVFSSYGPLFALYSQYTDSQEFASRTIQEYCKKDKDFAAFINTASQDDMCKGQNLQSLLIMPVQRVPRYQLLLQEYRKQLNKDDTSHPDIPLVEQALEKVKGSANHINGVIRVRQNKERLIELETQWANSYKFLAPDRWVLKEGKLEKQVKKKGNYWWTS